MWNHLFPKYIFADLLKRLRLSLWLMDDFGDMSVKTDMKSRTNMENHVVWRTGFNIDVSKKNLKGLNSRKIYI